MSTQPVHVFTYGTLQSRSPNFEAIIKNNAVKIQPASLEGILIMQNKENEPYPWLVQDTRTLKNIEDRFGIRPMTIKGELVEFPDSRPLEELDAIENFDSNYIGVEQHELPQPFTNAYLRRRSQVTIRNPDAEKSENIFSCYVYVYNPGNRFAQKILDKKKTKRLIIVPGGNWKEYMKQRPNRTLDQPEQHFSSIGMETEVQVEVNGTPLPTLRKNRKFHFLDDEGKELRPDSLKKFLSQAFYYVLKNDNLGKGTLNYFYEKNPKVNSRFPIPFGLTYVDGELIQENGESDPIRPVVFNQFFFSDGNLYTQRTERPQLVPHEHFFEIAGMPIRVESGFARKQVEHELVRRFYLSKTLDCLKAVKVDGQWNNTIDQKLNSTQFSAILDPTIDSIDLSPIQIDLTKHSDGTEKRKKYLCDIANVLGRTYGPLISFFLSGSSGQVNYNPRTQDRLEFRSPPISDPQQLEAGLYVFVASVQTVESKVKDYLRDRVARDLKSNLENISDREFRRVFSNISPEEMLDAFATFVPSIEYEYGVLRPGYCIDENTSYQKCIENPDVIPLKVRMQDEERMIPFMELIKELFYDSVFQNHLKSMVSTKEYESIECYVDEGCITEASTSPSSILNSEEVKKSIEYYSGKTPEEYLKGRGTFPELVSNMLLCNKGKYSFSDSTHSMEISIPLEGKNELYIGSIPMQISLYNKTSVVEKENENIPVDSFETTLKLSNFPQLLSAINNQKRDTISIWETYYSLK